MRRTLLVLAMSIELLAGMAEAALTSSFPKLLGETGSRVPFGDTFPNEWPPFRMQQVYAAAGFSNSMSQGGWITGMWLITDDQAGRGYSARLPKVEIRIGVTSRGPDALSPVFAENFDGPTIAVQPLGPLYIYGSGRGAYVEFGFVKPFFYDPASGNLMLEVKNYQTNSRPFDPLSNTSAFDASNVIGDTVSRVYAHGDADALTGTADSLGLTTIFEFTVPSLSIARQSTNLVLQWLRSPLVMNVERSLVLGPAAKWQPMSGPLTTNIVLVSNQFEFHVEFSLPLETRTPGAFFRLVLPGLSRENAPTPATALEEPANEGGIEPWP